MNTINVSFTGVKETLLLTLYTRAMDSHTKHPILGDKKAEEIVKRRPSQKLVLMTGYADELERAKHLGVPILAKPFDMDDLLDLIAPGVPH